MTIDCLARPFRVSFCYGVSERWSPNESMPAERVSPVTEDRSATASTSSSAESEEVAIPAAGQATPYQRLLQSLQKDERWQKELALGRRVGFYRFRGDLGTGNFAKVKVAIHCLTKEKVAVKIVEKGKLDAKTQRMLAREVASMEALQHPHLIRLFEVLETLSRIYLVTEYAGGGELFQRISSEGRFSEADAGPIFAQVTDAIDYMHHNNIIHRDIKAENVFFASHTIVKVGDFGFSKLVRSREEALSTFCGSPPYAAPELFQDESYEGPFVDVWALGVLLFFMVCGSMPFKAQTVAALKKLILESEYSVPPFLTDSCRSLICGMLQRSPQARLTLAQVRASDWLRNLSQPIIGKIFDESKVGEAKQQLKLLGITDAMLVESEEKGARSNITGTYRIMLHRLQQGPNEKSPICSVPLLNTKMHKKLSLTSTQRSRKSRTCVLL